MLTIVCCLVNRLPLLAVNRPSTGQHSLDTADKPLVYLQGMNYERTNLSTMTPFSSSHNGPRGEYVIQVWLIRIRLLRHCPSRGHRLLLLSLFFFLLGTLVLLQPSSDREGKAKRTGKITRDVQILVGAH